MPTTLIMVIPRAYGGGPPLPHARKVDLQCVNENCPEDGSCEDDSRLSRNATISDLKLGHSDPAGVLPLAGGGEDWEAAVIAGCSDRDRHSLPDVATRHDGTMPSARPNNW